ncbi:hypothetical protein ACQR5W_08390 [Xanthomonas sacchari]|nr:hypothetical protein [Xanthomonas sp. SHU 308]
MLGLVDGNYFYASCERVFNPSLHGRPGVVLSNKDGCAIVRSREAKGPGVTIGRPHPSQDRCGSHLISADLARADPDTLRLRHMVTLASSQRELQRIACGDLEASESDRQQIVVPR